MRENPLLNFERLPPFGRILPRHVGPAVAEALANAGKAASAATQCAAAPSWENACQPLEEACEGIGRVWNQVEHLCAINGDAAWSKARRDNLPKVAAFFAALGQNEKLERRWRALAKSPAFARLAPARQKIVRDGLRDFSLAGVALPPARKKTFRHNSERLAALGAKFEENLLAATNGFALHVDDEKTLGEMPADLRAAAARAAKAAGHGGWRFTLHAPSYFAFMRHSPARRLRQKMHRAHAARASALDDKGRDNTPIIKEVLQRRRQQARLLGFANYAEMALQTRMAKTPAAAEKFLLQLAAKTRPQARRELAQLQKFAASRLGIANLRAWDMPYAAEKMRKAKFDFSDAELRPYLQANNIAQGLFGLARRLFGVCFAPARAPLAGNDARYYELRDANGKALGGLYLDLYANAKKRGGAWMSDALSRCRRNGKMQLPVAHIVCNFAKPAAGASALLDWDEATTLFHEFGHALHHLLTKMSDYSVSGIAGVEWDAVELPSQWLENFIWDYPTLAPMTRHAQSGKRMPRALFAKVERGRKFGAALWLARQLEFAIFDLRLHRAAANAPLQKTAALARQTAGAPPAPAYNRFACGFSHIFAGGYAAGYYSYLWAEVLAADIFAMFAGAPRARQGALGRRFWQETLAAGGGRPAMEGFLAMRGREPDPRPFLQSYGLAA